MLTTRQKTLLKLIVEDYVVTATPIASEAIARNHHVHVSSATIRNEVMLLEETGYLTRPYTSAGTVPLDKAYRLYVESLTDESPNDSETEVKAVRQELGEVERDVDEWTSGAAAILAKRVRNMAVVTPPKANESKVKHIELVPLQDSLVMLIVVLEQASLRRHLIRLDGWMEPSELEASTNRVKTQLIGLGCKGIAARDMSLTPLEQEVVGATMLILKEEDKAHYRNHYINGLRNLLNQPEFSANDQIYTLVKGMEEGELAQAVLEETPEGRLVRVIIGEENREDLLWPLSVVICQYGIPGEATGVVGAIGPKRMEYPKTIADVRVMASAMSGVLELVYNR